MYVSCTRVNTGDLPIETATIVAEELHPWLADLQGFRGFLMLSREGSAIALSFWESRDVAERHRVVRMQLRERVTELAGGEIEEVVDYDVTFGKLGPLDISPAADQDER
jgi:hypothetical protein